jgi:signal peptidase I
MKKIIKELYPYIAIVMVVVLFRTFIATPVRVDGDSMKDTLHNNDILILHKESNTHKKNCPLL